MKHIFWLVVRSHFLYTSKLLEVAEAWATEMATELSMVLLFPFIYKMATKTNLEIPGIVVISPDDDVEISTIAMAT